VQQRASALVEAMAEATVRRDEGEQLVAPVLADIVAAMDRLAAEVGERPSLQVSVHLRIEAVPDSLRRRAPGVDASTSRVDYETGVMLVAEHQPQYSFTLVAGVALQVIVDGTIRSHAVIRTERWDPAGNERQELWRGVRASDHEELSALVTTTLADIDEALLSAIRAFDELRGVAAPS
jgi:hypothetical protein